MGAPRADFYRFIAPPKRRRKIMFFRHRPKSSKTEDKATPYRPRVDFYRFLIRRTHRMQGVLNYRGTNTVTAGTPPKSPPPAQKSTPGGPGIASSFIFGPGIRPPIAHVADFFRFLNPLDRLPKITKFHRFPKPTKKHKNRTLAPPGSILAQFWTHFGTLFGSNFDVFS